VQDLLELGEHQCYARISSGGKRFPSFSVQLDPPPAGEPGRAAALARQSAAHYGREAAQVEGDLQSAAARIELTHTPPAPAAGAASAAESPGRAQQVHTPPIPSQSPATQEKQTRRNDHRARKRRRHGEVPGSA
jgi:hypothetical protein